MTLPPRFLMATIRLLHIHVSMFAMLLMLLYAVSGLMLNHGDSLGGESSKPAASIVQIPQGLKPGETAAAIRSATALRGHLESTDETADELRLVFARPGYRAEAVVQRATGKTDLSIENRGFAGILNDLHRGQHVQGVWRAVTDTAAVILALLAVTGLILWWSLPVRRRWGTIWLALGGVGLVIVAAMAF